MNNVANDKQAKGDNDPKERQLLDAIFSIISEVTGEQIRLEEIVVTETGKHPIWVKVGESSTPILFELVSQGYNNVFGWIGYFMKRMVDVTPNGDDFTKTPAIVLVDEIDTYLHPKWQAEILAVLVSRFPNVQFIVTTHSPYVIGSVPKGKIKVFICKQEGSAVEVEEFTEFTPFGADLDRLSEKAFGVKGRFVTQVRENFEQLARLIHQGDLAQAKAFLKNNFSDIDQNDPELNRSANLIRTKEILAK